jgi:L-aspartate oxidase
MIFDYIIIGAGIAGLYSALNIPPSKKVLIISKEPLWECNTFYAQGGISAARGKEDIKSHIEDTLKAGCGICDRKAVEILSSSSIDVIENLIRRGFSFDKDEKGNILYTKESAHSRSRILHAGGDATGRELHLFLLKNIAHPILEGALVIDLLIDENRCYGITVAKGDSRQNFYGKNIFLASGGIGSLYDYHTNAKTVSADIHGIAIEKGIKLKDMEFTQFHPTVFIKGKKARKLLLTEALRGEGATVIDENGERFLYKYDKRGELASRDIVSRAIFKHQLENHQVYLSFENFSEEFFKKRFPTIYKNFHELGFNVPYQKVPISPAFHFMMGGIEVDYFSKVRGFENLYAVGEIACSGVHGANRLASNSLLEALVFSKRAVEKSLTEHLKYAQKKFEITKKELILKNDKKLKNELRKVMWKKVGIIRTKDGLKEALAKVDEISKKNIGRMLRLRVLSAREIIKSALKREKSIGAHYIE